VATSRPAGAGRVYLEGASGFILLAVLVLLDQSSTSCPKLVQDKLMTDIIDIPEMGSAATAVNRAATGKRQVNFMMSTEDQAVTIDRSKKQIEQTSKSNSCE
jgi:hypothetical protein